MIALIIAHLIAYGDYYSFATGIGCAGWAWRMVRPKPGEKTDDTP
jgi:hypothetical protein